MNLKKIIIYDFDILFDILDEIKENLNFDLIKANKSNFKEKSEFLKTDYLVISRLEKKYLNNQVILDKVPIKIDELIEIINLNFLKKRFNLQSDISIGKYKLNLNSRNISKDSKIINLTEREINLIIFLKNSKKAVKVNKLQQDVWDYGLELETHTVETHIYRLRKKIKDEFNDTDFIISLKDGYFIDEKKK